METEHGGLEVLSGCFGLLALIFLGSGSGIAYFVKRKQERRNPLGRQRLNDLMADFCTGADATSVQVQRIQILLMTSFNQVSEYEQLMTDVATFAPGGKAPFHDEAWLEEKFRVFLAGKGIIVPEQAKEQLGVWPPPPRYPNSL